MANDVPLLSVRDLKTYYFLDEGTVRAVDGVSFDIYPGQVVGVVGESGCGKSVTGRSILRIVGPPGRIVDGQILFRPQKTSLPLPERATDDGFVDLAALDPRGKAMRSLRGAEIALIPQEPMAAFSPVHTIGFQLVEAIRLHQPVDEATARQMAIQRLREVGGPSPEQRMDAYSWELSGGLRQRAVIAMALACNPSLLIADEPTTAIDVTTQAQVIHLLRALQREHNMAILFITHDLGIIAQIASYVVVMYLGQVVERGPVEAVFRQPQHPYTQALLRSIPSIFAPSRTLLPTIEGSIPHPFNRPPGCPFHPRCPAFMPGTCDRHTPTLQPVNERQWASCFLYHPPVMEPEHQGQAL